MMRLLGLVLALVLGLAPSASALQACSADPAPRHAATTDTTAATDAKRKVPTRAQWLADVRKAMKGSRGYVKERVATKTADEKLAVNFDIDNTVIATYYDGGGAIPRMLRFAHLLDRLDVALVFNSGRLDKQQTRTVRQLTRAGFDVAEVCLRAKRETLPVGKQRCRGHFIDEGYTLIANVGNNDTDFIGGGYERAFRLPSYGVMG
jgi:predicted secreted acid phosphatase